MWPLLFIDYTIWQPTCCSSLSIKVGPRDQGFNPTLKTEGSWVTLCQSSASVLEQEVKVHLIQHIGWGILGTEVHTSSNFEKTLIYNLQTRRLHLAGIDLGWQ